MVDAVQRTDASPSCLDSSLPSVDVGRYGLWLTFLLLLRPQKDPLASGGVTPLSKAALCLVAVVFRGTGAALPRTLRNRHCSFAGCR